MFKEISQQNHKRFRWNVFFWRKAYNFLLLKTVNSSFKRRLRRLLGDKIKK